jgi:ADP-ribose pyrophosphatase YjhB (NUDIX family)
LVSINAKFIGGKSAHKQKIAIILFIFILFLITAVMLMLNNRVAGGIVYKINEDHSINYLLVTTKKEDKWVFPKGKVKFYECKRQAAIREVGEEAGIKARIIFRLKNNPFIYQNSSGKKQSIDLFSMEYIREKRHWKEENDRLRKWMTFSEASSVLTPELRLALEEVRSKLNDKTRME